jgi:hypothetical protein
VGEGGGGPGNSNPFRDLARGSAREAGMNMVLHSEKDCSKMPDRFMEHTVKKVDGKLRQPDRM